MIYGASSTVSSHYLRIIPTTYIDDFPPQHTRLSCAGREGVTRGGARGRWDFRCRICPMVTDGFGGRSGESGRDGGAAICRAPW